MSGWQNHLRSLPECDPDPALWLRLQQARSGRTTALRRVSPAWFWGAVAAAFLAIALVPSLRVELDSGQPVAPHSGVVGPEALADAGVRSSLAQLDGEIASAYARGAGEEEVSALWEVRERFVATLGTSSPALIARL